MLHSLRLVFLAALAVRQGICAIPSDPSSHVPYQAPLHGDDHPTRIPNTYLVAFRNNYTIGQHWRAIDKDLSSSPDFVHYDHLFGYTAKMDADTLDLVRRDRNVDFVETDRYEMDAVPRPNGTAISHDSSLHNHPKRQTAQYNTIVQPEAPWNLQMISAAGKQPVPMKDFAGSYTAVSNAGRGVNIYILDTGIRISHNRFGGRASNFKGLSPSTKSPYCADGSTMNDVIGHGTFMAGVAGAERFGVAQDANLINVKVITNDGGFKYGLLVKAVNDVYAEHRKNYANKKGWDFRGSVMNMSWGRYGNAFWLHRALSWADWYGVNLVASAGNDNRQADRFWPCNTDEVMCVAAVDRNYKKSSISNYGGKITFLGPGEEVVSTWNTDDNALAKDTGTSIAAAHVSGTAAIFISWRDLTLGGAESYVWWNSLGGLTKGWPWFFSSTKNNLVNTGIKSPKKYKKEPFRWARDNPYVAAGGGVRPLANMSNTPPGLSASGSFLSLTGSGANITQSVSRWPSISGTGGRDTLLQGSGVVNMSVSGTPVPSLPASIKSALGLSSITTMTSASVTSCGVNKPCPPAPTGSTSRCMEVDGRTAEATCSYGPTPSTTSSSSVTSIACTDTGDCPTAAPGSSSECVGVYSQTAYCYYAPSASFTG